METMVRVRRAAVLCCCVSLAAAGGCPQATSIFSPELLQSLGLTQSAADLPGEAPALLVTIENTIGRRAEYRLSWRDNADEVDSHVVSIPAESERGIMLICPVREITLGDIGNPNATGAIVLLGNGTAEDAFIEVEPFGVVLEDGVQYDCGDEVKFKIQYSSDTLSGYRIFAYVTHAGVQSSASAN